MWVFVDDLRNPPEGWIPARTSEEAISFLRTGEVERISLDHDLGGEDTGYKVACFMEEHGIWPKEVLVHSMNPVGRGRIEAVIRRKEEHGS